MAAKQSGSCAAPASRPTTMDLRQLVAEERRPRVFEAFGRLRPGDTLLLTHFHHAMPLKYLLLAEAPRGFTWDYLQQGPQVWRIRIRKNGDRVMH